MGRDLVHLHLFCHNTTKMSQIQMRIAIKSQSKYQMIRCVPFKDSILDSNFRMKERMVNCNDDGMKLKGKVIQQYITSIMSFIELV